MERVPGRGFVTFSDFDVDQIVNLHTGDYGSGPVTGVWQRWDEHSVVGYPFWAGFQERSIYPSYWNISTGTWDLGSAALGGNWPGQNEAWAIDNIWHFGHEYSIFGGLNFRRFPGVLIDTDGQTGNDALQFDSFTHTASGWGHNEPGLQATYRIVHPGAPDTITWSTFHNDSPGGPTSVEGTIVGPGQPQPPVLGDFSGDGVVDENDINMLIDEVNAATNNALFDLTGDDPITVDQADVDQLIFTILGTMYGDLNLDQLVNDQDAAVLAGNWQQQGGATWGDGDITGDGNVNDQDAAILAGNWQFDGTSSLLAVQRPATPEPSGIFMGAVALMLFGGTLWRRRTRRFLNPRFAFLRVHEMHQGDLFFYGRPQ